MIYVRSFPKWPPVGADELLPKTRLVKRRIEFPHCPNLENRAFPMVRGSEE